MSEYFLILLKQYGNLRSEAEAKRVAQAVTDALDVYLPKAKSRQFFNNFPRGVRPSQLHFYDKLFGLHTAMREHDFMKRISLQLALTDSSEINHLVDAYFRVVKDLVSDVQAKRISQALPPVLLKYYLTA